MRHSREGGNPDDFELNSRLRGSDNHFTTDFLDTTTEEVSKPMHKRSRIWTPMHSNVKSAHKEHKLNHAAHK